MTSITNIDGVTFEIDGIRYYKNFVSLVAGNSLRIINIYDVGLELSGFKNYTEYEVNGNTFGNVGDLQKALLPVLFTRASLNGVVIDGDIVNVELVGDTLTFTLSDMSVVNIELPYVRSVSGTAVNDADPRNVIIDKYPNITTTFALDLSSATLSSDLIDVAVTAINSQSPFNINDGEQAVFFFDAVDGLLVRRYYFRDTTGQSTITTVDSNTIIAEGETTFVLADNQIDLGDIGVADIEDGFNSSPSEPFTISGQTFIIATQNAIDQVWYWNGGNGQFGDTGLDGQATASDFILLKDGTSIGSFIPSSEKGSANGVATLDGSGLVPTSQLPSYVDDVLEGEYINSTTFNDTGGTPYTPESGKIYLDTSGGANDGNQYRWTGSIYFQITNQSAEWGSIGGTLSSQTDLQNELDAKADLSGGNTFIGNQDVTGNLEVNGLISTIGIEIENDSIDLLNLYRPNSSTAAQVGIDFDLNGNLGIRRRYARIVTEVLTNTDASVDGKLIFNVTGNGSGLNILTLDKNSASFNTSVDITGNLDVSGLIQGDGSLLTNVDADTLDGLNSADFARSTGTTGQTINPKTSFLSDLSLKEKSSDNISQIEFYNDSDERVGRIVSTPGAASSGKIEIYTNGSGGSEVLAAEFTQGGEVISTLGLSTLGGGAIIRNTVNTNTTLINTTSNVLGIRIENNSLVNYLGVDSAGILRYGTNGDVVSNESIALLSDIDKAFVDALNVDADTLDGLNSTQLARTDIFETFNEDVSFIKNLGIVGNINFSSSGNIQNAGNIQGDTIETGGYTVAGLPAGTQGMTAYVTDSGAVTYRGTVAGGGANVALVFYDGTNWIYH